MRHSVAAAKCILECSVKDILVSGQGVRTRCLCKVLGYLKKLRHRGTTEQDNDASFGHTGEIADVECEQVFYLRECADQPAYCG